LLLDRAGTLWAGTRNGLFRRRAGERDFQLYPLPAPDGPAPVVRSLHEDRAGRIWIGTDLVGVFILEPGTDAPRRLLDAAAGGRPIAEGVPGICEVDDAEVWLATSENGILRVNTATWSVQRVQRDLARAHSLPSNQVDTLFMDRSGSMWVGTRAALSRLDPRQRLVQTYYGGKNPGLVLDDEAISALLAQPDGRVWLALQSGGVEIVDPVAGRVGRLPTDADDPGHALPKSEAITMARWSDGSVFLGMDAGLYRASGDGRKVERVQVPGRSPAFDVRSLLASGGRLWLGGLDGLLELAVSPGGSLAVQRHWDKELGDPRVRTLVAAKGEGIWIGTPSGASYLDMATGTITRLENDPRDAGKLPGGYISSMITDRHGRLWVATFGRGIEIEQGRNADGAPSFRRLTQAEGLPQNSVDALLQDASGTVWASTDGGLARIDPDTLSIRAFRAEHGVGIDGFFTGIADVTAGGELLFGGLNGMVVVHPQRFSPGDAAPAMVVTDVRVGGRSQAASPGLLAEGLNVGAHDRSLAVEFAALDFTDPESRRYSYRLRGFDADWQATPVGRRLASYTNLPAGDYALEMRSAAPGAGWSAPLEIPVHVQPAWYEHGAARVLAAALTLALLVALVQTRTLVLRRRQAALERLVAERTAQLKRSQEYLERMAYFDSLTALPNRRMFNDHLRRLIAGCHRGHGDFTLLIVDLDGFKNINDMFGHDVGDGVLVEVAARLRSLIRETDLPARLGGDEFGVLLQQPRDREAVEIACKRIVDRLREPIGISGHFVVVGASIGIAGVPDEGTTPDEMLKAADTALYEAKNAGRNTWRWDRKTREEAAGPEAAARATKPADVDSES
jgi:diguanylate cyclase (GGDEF)-like protein